MLSVGQNLPASEGSSSLSQSLEMPLGNLVCLTTKQRKNCSESEPTSSESNSENEGHMTPSEIKGGNI